MEEKMEMNTVEVKEPEVTYTLSAVSMLNFVQDVMETVFNEEYGYMPEFLEYAIRFNVMTRYGHIEMPEDIQERYMLIYDDRYRRVLEYVNIDQLDNIIDAIDRKIEHRLDMEHADAERKLNEMTQKMNDAVEMISGLTKEIDPEDVKKLASALAEHGPFDEGKIVQAYLDKKTES